MKRQAIRTFAGKSARETVRLLAGSPHFRVLLNQYYLSLDSTAKARFHQRYARIFDGQSGVFKPGEWIVSFGGKKIRLPLRPDDFSLDWTSALSIVGHDPDVKTTYESLISSPGRPDVFLDVGANYGTHSILFAAHAIQTIAFEPNPNCRNYCNAVCVLNGLTVAWEPVAIGDREGEVELHYPRGETWLGSIVPEITKELASYSQAVSVVHVRLRQLDDWATYVGKRRALVKIDVEGGELSVLKGASELLWRSRPIVIFESNERSKRRELAKAFAAYDYSVFCLPFPERRNSLSVGEFETSAAVNFLAQTSDARARFWNA